jgi:hypothetical protein
MTGKAPCRTIFWNKFIAASLGALSCQQSLGIQFPHDGKDGLIGRVLDLVMHEADGQKMQSIDVDETIDKNRFDTELSKK